jgi:hypothetical protein
MDPPDFSHKPKVPSASFYPEPQEKYSMISSFHPENPDGNYLMCLLNSVLSRKSISYLINFSFDSILSTAEIIVFSNISVKNGLE